MKYLITPILLSSILMLISCSEDTTAGEELSSLAITLQMPSKQEVETRVGLSPIERSKDLYAIWSSNDKVQAILRRGNEMFDLGRAKVTNISNDHRTATINFDRRATPNYNPPYTIYLFTGNTHPASADAIGGGNWSAYCTYDIIRESLESFNAPMFSQIVVNGKDVPVAHFTHFGTYELLHLKNDTNMPITVVHQGFNCEKPWYQASTTVWFNDDYDHTNLSGEWEGDVDSPEFIIMPHADRTIVSWYIPSGYKVNNAQLVATIDGKAGITSTNTFSSNVTLQRGHAYHMYATWDGKELKFSKGDVTTASTIKVEPTEIDFGVVEYGNDKKEIITVTNTGNVPTTFAAFSDPDFTEYFEISDNGRQFTIEPLSAKKITIICHGMETGHKANTDIFINANNGKDTVKVSLSAVGMDSKSLVEPNTLKMSVGEGKNLSVRTDHYRISNNNPNVVSVSRGGSSGTSGGGARWGEYDYNSSYSFSTGSLEIEAFAVGTAKINITDEYSGKESVLTIIVSEGSTVSYLSCPDDNHPHAIDLGLPSGTLWACCNVGASKPEDYGGYYAWGETEEKNDYSFATYKWCMGSGYTMTKYCTDPNYGYNGFTDGKTILEQEDDAAFVHFGNNWRMPTIEQFNELYQNCSKHNTTQNGVYGLVLTGPNESKIFLPAADQKDDFGNDDHELYGSYPGYYWSLTASEVNGSVASAFEFDSGRGSTGFDYDKGRQVGLTIRPVNKAK